MVRALDAIDRSGEPDPRSKARLLRPGGDLAGRGTLEATLRELPEATQIPVICQLPLVVEFYSR